MLTKFSFPGAETHNFVVTPFVHISIIYAQTVYEQNFVEKVLQKNENSSYQKKVEKNILQNVFHEKTFFFFIFFS